MIHQTHIQADGVVVATAGTQLNCAGFARIWVRITPATSAGLALRTGAPSQPNPHRQGAAEMDQHLRSAVFRGARWAFDRADDRLDLCFELIEALVHPVDATEPAFFEAGRAAMRAWLVQLERP